MYKMIYGFEKLFGEEINNSVSSAYISNGRDCNRCYIISVSGVNWMLLSDAGGGKGGKS